VFVRELQSSLVDGGGILQEGTLYQLCFKKCFAQVVDYGWVVEGQFS